MYYFRLAEIQQSLRTKYRCAQALTLVSLLAMIGLCVYSGLWGPRGRVLFRKSRVGCRLPSELWNQDPQDGSYGPPAPHASLLHAVQAASEEDYAAYCVQYSPARGGFSSDWQPYAQGECGHWQEAYTELHQKHMAVLARYKQGDLTRAEQENQPRFVSYHCPPVPKRGNRGCGGLADRMGGMVSTFLYALLTGRAYLLHWSEMNPLPLEDIWEKPRIDWSHDPEQMASLFRHPLLGHQKVDLLNKRYRALTAELFPKGSASDFNQLWNSTYVEVRSNRGFVIRTFQMSPKYRARLNQMGLTQENSFRCITHFLFGPKLGSRRFLNAYQALFRLPSVLSIGIQIRTDDHALASPEQDHHRLTRWAHFLQCASDLARAQRKPSETHVVFFLVTDSAHLRNAFVALNTDQAGKERYLGQEMASMASLVITGLPIEHIEPEQIAKQLHVKDLKEINRLRMQPGVNSAYMENWLLGQTQYRVISAQGYGKMAAFYSGQDLTSISMPKHGPRPVCSAQDAFTSFDWLSTQWSLG